MNNCCTMKDELGTCIFGVSGGGSDNFIASLQRLGTAVRAAVGFVLDKK
jgi:hypothetical protein